MGRQPQIRTHDLVPAPAELGLDPLPSGRTDHWAVDQQDLHRHQPAPLTITTGRASTLWPVCVPKPRALAGPDWHADFVSKAAAVKYRWRGPLADAEMLALVTSHEGTAFPGWWDRVRDHSLGWVTARHEGQLIGFVNVAWDGGVHAFLLDTKTRGDWQRQGIATAVVALAAEQARLAGCEWLHVDFTPDLAAFYIDACGFRPTAAGLIHIGPQN